MAMLSNQREAVIAIAGVFILLPTLVVGLFGPAEPEPSPDAGFAQFVEAYQALAPWMAAASLVQMVGTLAVLALLLDGERPTAGEALRVAGRLFLPYLGALLILSVAFGLALGIPLGLGMASGSPALIGVLVLAATAVGIVVSLRLFVLPAAIVAERIGSPVAALRRSWQLTAGNALRILAFLAVFLIVVLVIGVLAGIVAGVFQFIGGGVGNALAQVISALFGSAVTVALLGVYAAAYRQLAGPGRDVARTFD